MTLEERFSSLIKEELPGKVGSELKEVLIKAEKDAEEILKLESIIREDTLKQSQLYEENSKLKAELSSHRSLDTKLVDIEKREKALEVTILKIQLEESNKRADLISSYTTGLVRNVQVRKGIFDGSMTQVPVTDNNGYTRMEYSNSNKTYNETKIVE
jgi:hypothetical protein